MSAGPSARRDDRVAAGAVPDDHVAEPVLLQAPSEMRGLEEVGGAAVEPTPYEPRKDPSVLPRVHLVHDDAAPGNEDASDLVEGSARVVRVVERDYRGDAVERRLRERD